MNEPKKSDMGIVAGKPTNKGAQATAESVEQRPVTNGNPRGQSTGRTQRRATVTQAVERIRQFVKRKPQEKLTALLHHVTPEALREAHYSLKREAAPGVDGMTWREYETGLEGRLHDLHRRVHTGAYRATPVRRVNIDKPDGGTRPLGVAALEDKIVQRAVVDVILTPIYEEGFLGISYGFRPGRGAHDALDAVAYAIERRKVNWILDADIRAYFDTISRDWMIRFLEHRIGDRRVLRLIAKWMRAGVLEEGRQIDTGRGTVQGSVISPMLANIYLHYVLDLWVVKKWRPQEARGDMIIVRYADDYVAGFEHRDDAERFLRELQERFRGFDLELNADKTRLIEFGRNAERNRRSRGEGRPETFEFLGFTYYCRKDRKGHFGLGRKPVRKRMSRTLERIKRELRRRMHDDVMDTGRWLGTVLRGWLNYYAVPTSFRYLRQFRWRLRRIWIRVLRRRSQKDRCSWTWMLAISNNLWPKLRIVHPWPTTRFAVNHRR
jgi:group II intron reverse transcriptase/maturase